MLASQILLAWVMMGLALWHFTIIHGGHIPGRNATHLLTALEGIPGALAGIGLVYAKGLRRVS
jgi:hypothetical protein